MSDTFEFEDQSRVERLTGTLHDPAATTGDVLTVQADKSIAAQPGAGSGGVQVVTVPVSSAQILDLFNTPVVLVPGVAGNAIIPTGNAIAYLAGATPYTDNGGDAVINVGSAGAAIVVGAGFWDKATSQIAFTGYGFAFSGAELSLFDGQDLVLLEDLANPTLGDGTLLVTVSYFLAPTV